jgi:hypothetical protein
VSGRAIVYQRNVPRDSDAGKCVLASVGKTMTLEIKLGDESQPSFRYSGLSVEIGEEVDGLLPVTWFYPVEYGERK